MTWSTLLRAPRAVTSRVPFVITVDVEPVSPGRRVTVSLEHKRGDEQARPLASVEIDYVAGETAYASFQLTLRERGTVLVLATAYDDAGTCFHPDVCLIEVL